MEDKLIGSKFRWINETLYNTPSPQALELFQKQTDLFEQYHCGFRRQVEAWPVNPVNKMISRIAQRLQEQPGSNSSLPMVNSVCVIADLGCGDATIFKTYCKVQNLKVLNFDLVASKDVVAADIADLPLANASINIAILCLSLMGPNMQEFVKEAARVLRADGELWIAEVRSRFVDVDGSSFIEKMKAYGFELSCVDRESKFFLDFVFIYRPKAVHRLLNDELEAPLLKPCVYKKR